MDNDIENKMMNNQIKKLVGTTDKMIDSIRLKNHWNMKNIKPRDIVLLGLFSQAMFNEIISQIKSSENLTKKTSDNA